MSRVTAAGRVCLLGLGVQLMTALAGLAQSTQAVTSHQTPQLMDRQKEMALALSACPPSSADKAAVCVLESSGYVKVRESQNGFTAIVSMVCRSAKIRSIWMPKVHAHFFHAI